MSKKRNKGIVPEPVIKFNESLSKNVHLINIIQNVINTKKMDIFRSYISGYNTRNGTNITEPTLATIYEPYSETLPTSSSLNIPNIVKSPLSPITTTTTTKPVPVMIKLFNLFFKTMDSCVVSLKNNKYFTEEDNEPDEKDHTNMNLYDVCEKLPLIKDPDPEPYLFTRTPSSTTYPFQPENVPRSDYISQFHNLGKHQSEISNTHVDYIHNDYGILNLKGTNLEFKTPLEVTPLRSRLCPSESYEQPPQILVLYICSHGSILFNSPPYKENLSKNEEPSLLIQKNISNNISSSPPISSSKVSSKSANSTNSDLYSDNDSNSNDSVRSHNEEDETTNQYAVPFIFNNKYTDEPMIPRPIPHTKYGKTPYVLTESFKKRYRLTTGDPKISQFSRFVKDNLIMWPYASLGLHGTDNVDTNMLFDLNVVHDVLSVASRIKNRKIQDILLQTLVYLNGPTKIPGRASFYNLPPTEFTPTLRNLWWSTLYRSERGIPIKWNIDVSYSGDIFYEEDRNLLKTDAINLAKKDMLPIIDSMTKKKKRQYIQKLAQKIYNESVMKYDKRLGILYTNIENNEKYKKFYKKINDINREMNIPNHVTLLSDIIKLVVDYYPNVQLNIIDFACKGSTDYMPIDMTKSHFEMSNYIDSAIDQIRSSCHRPISIGVNKRIHGKTRKSKKKVI